MPTSPAFSSKAAPTLNWTEITDSILIPYKSNWDFEIGVVCLFGFSVKPVFPFWEQRLIQSFFCSSFKWFGSHTGPVVTEITGQSLPIINLKMQEKKDSKPRFITSYVSSHRTYFCRTSQKVSGKIKSYKRYNFTTYTLQACQNK